MALVAPTAARHLELLLVVRRLPAPRRRCAGGHAAAEPTLIPPVVAIGTEGSVLTTRPLLRRDAVLGLAVVAIPPRVQPTVHTRAAQHRHGAHGQHLHRRQPLAPLIHGRTVGRRPGRVRAAMLEPDAYRRSVAGRVVGNSRQVLARGLSPGSCC